MVENQFRLRLGELALRLFERGLVRPRINREEQIALFYVSAILKMTRGDLPAHLRLHLHSFVRSAGPNFIEVKWHVLCNDFRDKNRSHWWLSRFGLANSVLQDPIHDKGGQHDEEQIRPAGNMVRATRAFQFHLRPSSTPRSAFLLEIGCRSLFWPLWLG